MTVLLQNRMLSYEAIVEHIMNINEYLAMIVKRRGSIDVLSELRSGVEHYVDAVMEVANEIEGKGDKSIPWNDLQKKIFKDV